VENFLTKEQKQRKILKRLFKDAEEKVRKSSVSNFEF
jgi:hypothetical protein